MNEIHPVISTRVDGDEAIVHANIIAQEWTTKPKENRSQLTIIAAMLRWSFSAHSEVASPKIMKLAVTCTV